MRFVLLGIVVASAACGRGDRAASAADTATAKAEGTSDVALKLPPGFTATVFAENLGGARHLVAAPNGNVYVNTWLSPYDTTRRVPEGGYVVALRDTNTDGKADLIRRFGSTRESGSRGGTGIALWRGNQLFVEADSEIVWYSLPKNELVPTADTLTLVSGLTTSGGHPMHPIAVDERNLYVNLGSDTNSCQVKDRELESPGQRPCRELQVRAGIWRFDIGNGQRFNQARRFATGIRNAGGLAIYPGGTLYATQHGRDQLTQNWPKLYDQKQGANLPSEELLRVERGGDYGWPYCYYDPTVKRLVLAPEYGGDGKKVGECAQKRGPVAVFPAHWAPNALVFYDGKMFPQSYRGGAFIAFHGSWNRAPEPQDGYNVVFQPMAQGKATGAYQVFADGFAGARKEPGLAAHRPSGLAVGPDGALYISDDQRGTVWKVSYKPQ